MGLENPPKVEFFRGKRVLVTGASGLIGGYVTGLLIASGAKVLASRRLTGPSERKRRWAAPEHLESISVDLINGDDARWAIEERDLDCVLSCAGLTGGVGLTSVDPISYVTLSTVITANTLHAAWAAKVPLFGFLSSTTVYPPSGESVREDYPGFAVRPQDMPPHEMRTRDYGEPFPLYAGIGYSKRFLEQACAYVSDKSATKCAIVRPSGAYGRFDNFDETTSHVIPGMINRAMRLEDGEDFVIWGDGEDVRDVVHAQDVAHGLLLATAATGEGRVAPATPFNIASGGGITTRELAGRILSATGKHGSRVVCDPNRLSALKVRRVSIAKAQRELGYDPGVPLDEGLRDTIAWRREQGGR